MSDRCATLLNLVSQKLGAQLTHSIIDGDELTIEIPSEKIQSVAMLLRDDPALKFDMLIDLCGVDYLHYGCTEWMTEEASSSGFERGVNKLELNVAASAWDKPRFAVVYHLLSIEKNQRIRVRSFLAEHHLIIDSVISIWASANWYEREAFDLFGILFKHHPDLRRILTDYGFVGHPFRKDFPLIGEVAMRYDALQQRVVYEPVDIEARTLIPKVIRKEVKGESV